METVLIGRLLMEKAVRRFLRVPQAEIVPFDRIPGQLNSHFAVANMGVEMPVKMYKEVEIFMYEGSEYQVFLQSGFLIEKK